MSRYDIRYNAKQIAKKLAVLKNVDPEMSGDSGDNSDTDEIPTGESESSVLKLKNLDDDDLAELYSGQYQGDMVLSEEEIEELETGVHQKQGLISKNRLWPDGIIPYEVIPGSYTPEQVAYLYSAVRTFDEQTCLKVIPYNQSIHQDYIAISGDESGCHSPVGRQGGRQIVNMEPSALGKGCFRTYTIIHELIHATGFFHMQSASNRDEYIKINWENIKKDKQKNFVKFDASIISNYGVEYDYGSVMHYSKNAFATNVSEDTIIPLQDLKGAKMGQRERLSENDVLRIYRVYCNDGESMTSPSSTTALAAISLPNYSTINRLSSILQIIVFVKHWSNY